MLPDERVTVLYTHRTAPEGVRLAVGYSRFTDGGLVSGPEDEALLGEPDRRNPLAVNMAHGFGKMCAKLLPSGEVMTTYSATVNGFPHYRWAKVRAG